MVSFLVDYWLKLSADDPIFELIRQCVPLGPLKFVRIPPTLVVTLFEIPFRIKVFGCELIDASREIRLDGRFRVAGGSSASIEGSVT